MCVSLRRQPLRFASSERAKAQKNRSLSQNVVIAPLETVRKPKKALPGEEEVTEIDPNNPYELIYINQNEIDEMIQCDVCLDYEHEEENQIVICELCNAGVH